MKTQICLVSAQAAANLLPALDNDLKPDRALLVVSTTMEQRARHMKKIFEEVGIATEELRLSDENNLSAVEEELLDWATKQEDEEVILNLTGGTKLMALAAQSVAKTAGWSTFYLNLDTNHVAWLEPKGSSITLSERLRLRHYLQGYGFSLDRKPTIPRVTHEQQSVMDTLVTQIGSLEKALPKLNWLGQQCENRKRLDIQLKPAELDDPGLDVLLRNFTDAGQLHVKDDSLIFESEEALSFVKGGWLEAHVFRTLAGIDRIHDKAANLEVRGEQDAKNELDAVFMAGNRLFVIECKTARMDRPESPKANDALFKLAENCRRIGGIGTKGMLVSYRSLREAEKKLAKALNIRIVSGHQIARLAEHIETWI